MTFRYPTLHAIIKAFNVSLDPSHLITFLRLLSAQCGQIPVTRSEYVLYLMDIKVLVFWPKILRRVDVLEKRIFSQYIRQYNSGQLFMLTQHVQDIREGSKCTYHRTNVGKGNDEQNSGHLVPVKVSEPTEVP